MEHTGRYNVNIEKTAHFGGTVDHKKKKAKNLQFAENVTIKPNASLAIKSPSTKLIQSTSPNKVS